MRSPAQRGSSQVCMKSGCENRWNDLVRVAYMNALKRDMAPKKVCLVVSRLLTTGKVRGSIPSWGKKTTGTWHFLIWPQNQIAQEWHLWDSRSEIASDLGLPEPILQLTTGDPLQRVADSEHRVPLLRQRARPVQGSSSTGHNPGQTYDAQGSTCKVTGPLMCRSDPE